MGLRVGEGLTLLRLDPLPPSNTSRIPLIANGVKRTPDESRGGHRQRPFLFLHRVEISTDGAAVRMASFAPIGEFALPHSRVDYAKPAPEPAKARAAAFHERGLG